MSWLWRALSGPILWAVLFSVVYGLHGMGCNLGWHLIEAPVANWHLLAMWLAWIVGLVLHVLLILLMPRGQGLHRRIIVLGAWIGFVSSLLTLAQVALTSSCVF